MQRHSFTHSKLNRKILLYILLVSSVFSIILTSLQLLLEFNMGKNNINQGIQSAELSVQDTLAQSLWLLEENIIDTQLRGLVQIDYIDQAKVEEVSGRFSHTTGEPKGSFTKEIHFPLMYQRSPTAAPEHLGNLTLTANYDKIYAGVLKQAGLILLVQTIKTFFVSAFILLILHQLILRHIAVIADYIRRFDASTFPEGLNTRLQLQRPRQDQDELTLLEGEINDLRERLHWHFGALSMREKALHQEVRQREQAEKKLHEQYLLSHNILESLRDAIFTVDQQGIIQQLNHVASKRFNSQPGDNITQQLKINCISDDETTYDTQALDLDALLADDNEERITGYCSRQNHSQNHRHDAPFPISLILHNTCLPNGEQGKTLILIDESESKQLEKISFQANHDLLTGLINRHRLSKLLQEVLDKNDHDGHHNSYYSLAFIDLDNLATSLRRDNR